MSSWGRAARLSLQAISRGVEPASTGCPASRGMAERMVQQQQSRGMAGEGACLDLREGGPASE